MHERGPEHQGREEHGDVLPFWQRLLPSFSEAMLQPVVRDLGMTC